MKVLLKPLQWIYSIYAFIVFILIMLLIFPVAFGASFMGHIKGGNLVFRLCMLWADLWFFFIFIYHRKIYESPHDKSRSYIFVSNHISYIDAAIIPKAFRQPIRALGKVEMSRVPVFGFIYKNAIVTVDRSDAAHRANSVRLLKSIISKGISVMVFPEGTFNTTTEPLKDFYDGAFRVAIETQTPIKPVIFLDAYRRLNYESIFSLTPGRSRLLYLEEIPVKGLGLENVSQLKDQVKEMMRKKMIEYDGAWRKS